jgi:hypothetical protein
MDDSNPDATHTTRFEDRRGRRRFTLRDAALCTAIVSVGLIFCCGDSLGRAAEAMQPGRARDVAISLAGPPSWVARQLPFAELTDQATAWLSPDDDLSGDGFATASARTAAAGSIPVVTADAFDPAQLGVERQRRPLQRLLVTGDSLAMPLDVELARRLTGGDGVRVTREAHVGSGISKSAIVDWVKLAQHQVKGTEPDAVVMFIGANEGFPLQGPSGKATECCGADWAAAYANRARAMIDTYRRGGKARVYWLTLPTPSDPDRARIAHAVNAAIRVAAEPYRAQVRVLDMTALFTPGERYRAAMTVGGREAIVRESDGIHLNDAGARVAADQVLRAIESDFRL